MIVDESSTLDGLRGIAAEVHDVAVQDHLVTHLDVRILGGPLAVSKVQDAVGVELVAVRGAIVGDIEGGIPVGTAGPERAAIGNLGDLTLHEHLRGTLDIGAEALDILDRARHGERVVQRADDFLAPFARLADSEGLVVIADGELDRLVAVVPGVVQDGERHPLGLVGGQALFRGHGDPGRLVGVPEDLAGPVPVRRHIQLQGRQGHVRRIGGLLGLSVERQVRSGHLEGGKVDIGFFLPAAGEEGGRRGQEGKEACRTFHIA